MFKKIIIAVSIILALLIASASFLVFKNRKLSQGIIVFDLDENGIDLIPMQDSKAFFDIDNDAMREKVSWVKSGDGILVIDKNSDKKIDNIVELFGQSEIEQRALEELFHGDQNKDSKIDNSDQIFNQLLIWRDYNGDGDSKPSELRTLESSGIISINIKWILDSEHLFSKDVIRKKIFFVSKINSKENEIKIVNLEVNQTNSAPKLEYELNLETLDLPFSRGYGDAKPWHIAMSEDSDLLTAMKDIVNLNRPAFQSEYNHSNNNLVTLKNLDQKIEEFIYLWTGTENVTGMRGVFDARKLATMEKIRGIPFKSSTGNTDIAAGQQADLVQKAWESLLKDVEIKILVQGTFRDIFSYTINDQIVSAKYDFSKDTMNFNELTADKLFDNLRNHFSNLKTQEDRAEFSRIMTKLITDISASYRISGLNQQTIKKDVDDISSSSTQHTLTQSIPSAIN